MSYEYFTDQTNDMFRLVFQIFHAYDHFTRNIFDLLLITDDEMVDNQTFVHAIFVQILLYRIAKLHIFLLFIMDENIVIELLYFV